MKNGYSDVWQAIADRVPDRSAVVSGDRSLGYAGLVTEAGALAHALADRGLRAGDGVAIFSHNRPEYLVTVLACLATGLAPVPMNYRYRAGELADLLVDADARALVFPDSATDVVVRALAGLDTPLLLIALADGGTAPPEALRYEDAVSAPRPLPRRAPVGGELRLYTGGTTGRPKAVVWDVAELFDVQRFAIWATAGIAPPATLPEAVEIAVSNRGMRPVTLPLAPFMHGTALFNSMNTLVLGGTVVVQASPGLDATDAVRLIRTHGVTRLIIAGDAVALPLLDAAEQDSAGLSTITSIISSGMRLSEAVKRRLHARGDVTISDMLASTEGGPYAVNTTTSAGDLPGVLRLLPGAVLLDEGLEEVQQVAGARGMLGFRGPLPKGYWRDEAKTAEAFRLVRGRRTVIAGDWAEALGDGGIELLGRGSSVVNTGGEKVYPAEVEEALLAHPAVADAVVLGIPDERFGEALTAVLVPADPERGLDPAAVTAFVGERLAGYKKPRHIVVRPSLDRSPHGKIDMVRLTREAAAAIATSASPDHRSQNAG
ncbi:MAG: hypothetical protein BGO04_06340 [Microbacterium sp. 70-38]|nr:MAG: hypothetical protein BGO04_06340 [Microbacterium sp. 70-38]